MTSTLRPAEVFPPSEYLREELEARGWTEVEFAQILDRPVQLVSEILNDRKEITAETALELGHALGTSPELWLNLQAMYRLSEARSTVDLSPVERRARLRNIVPVRDIRNRGWIEDTDNLDVLEASMCSFLGIESLDEVPFNAVAARRSNADDVITPEQTAWVARVRNLASEVEVARYDADALVELAPSIAQRLSDPFELPNLRSWLADVGVALVVELPLRSSKIDGASFWAGNTPVIGLSTRGNRFDGFVFTLLHEVAHLTREDVTKESLPRIDEELALDDSAQGIEAEANEVAAQWIFPGGLDAPADVTLPRVLELAEKYQVHVSLVVGRLQWMRVLTWSQYRRHIPRVRDLLDLGGEV